MMDSFHKEFLMGLFLDNDNVSTMNRLVVAVANIVNENNDNLCLYNELLKKEYKETIRTTPYEYLDVLSIPPTVKDYYDQVILKFTEKEYVARFKMRRSTVQTLIDFLKNYVKPGSIPLDKKVHVFLWFLISDSSYNEIGRLFGFHKSSVSYIFHEIASHLTDLRYNFINWPSVEEQHITRIKVNSRFKFPNSVGFIDACRFKVGSKRNKKPDVILLQAVCDESLMFTDVHIGEINRTKKNKVFKDSQLSQELKNFIDFDNHILGGPEYKLRKNLITPFTSEELLTSEEMKFNEIHWKARSYIGHAFELLKERFRKLNHIDAIKPESVNMLIFSACILHNFVLLHEGCNEIKEEVITCEDGVTMNTNIVKTAIEKRQFLCNYINYIDSEVPS